MLKAGAPRTIRDDVELITAAMAPLRAENERLRAENEQLRRWKALDKPLTVAMGIANSHLAEWRAKEDRLKAIVEEQAADEDLWFICRLVSEDYLQRALRRLHAAIEGKSPEECASAVLAGEQEQ